MAKGNKKYDIPFPPNSPAYQKEWRRRTNHSATNKIRMRELRTVILRHYSQGEPRCACCGETRYEFLSLDHVAGDGNKHRKQIGRGITMVRWIILNDFPPIFQVLCHNCNQAKGHYGYCPHERERGV
jgi:hypothetical protein